ncbi:MAG: hydantoinase/oxoprolinase family protein [Rhodoferax sp.]|nr:hydantoinase/oxoprolinase family protein [Rhodoferax sp.]
MSLLLGIDAGGTYTDAVLVDGQRRVLATAKSLTTRFDLSVGVASAIDQLPPDLRQRIGLVCLSTTLTTNSVVEGRGAPVCVLLAGYDEAAIRSSGLADLVGPDAIVALEGGHDATGVEIQPLDEVAACSAIARFGSRVTAFAISATFSVRNPAHELQLKKWVESLCDRPVTCGHELASSLGAPRRALTAALNARMVSHVRVLVDSVQSTLSDRRIRAPLMMVKGDGTLVNVETAMQQPVGTVLSGPAASLLGACALTGLRDAVVADMGGTTTDIAVVRGGHPALSDDGARVGPWRPMVPAARVYAIGLGGDSEVRLLGGKGLAIGPRRVIPLSLLGHQHPEVLPVLARQEQESPHASQMRFVMRLQSDAVSVNQLSDDERRAWDRLCQGPVDMERCNLEDRAMSRALARLERRNMAIYSGFTPSDAAHVLKLSNHWCRLAAVSGARIWARQMRHLYGLGTWTQGEETAPCQDVLRALYDQIAEKLLEAGLNDAGQLGDNQTGRLATLLAQLAVQPSHARDVAAASPVFQLKFSPDMPLIAVGAPAASYYPEVARLLGVSLVLPRFGEVANAVGAACALVSQRVNWTIAQPARGVFRVFEPAGPRDFDSLNAALAHACAGSSALARERATRAGAADVHVSLHQSDNVVRNDIDGDVFFEATVTAVASGPPVMSTKPDSTDRP